MKKITLFLALIMLFTSCFALSACGDNDSKSTSDVEDAISSEVEYALIAKIALQNVTGGKSYFYNTHTIRIKEKGNGEYSVSGTVTAISEGTKYKADYSGTAEYDSAKKDYNVDIEMGKLK